MTTSVAPPSTVILALRSDLKSDACSIALEELFKSKVIQCSNASAALEALLKNPTACVVIDCDIPGGPLTAFVERQAYLARSAHVIIVGGDESLLPEDGVADKIKVDFLPPKSRIKEIVAKVESILLLGGTAQEYCKITLKSLLGRSDRLKCDVYIKLGDEKFVKVLHASDLFDQAEYERFLAKGLDSLYLPRMDYVGLVDDLLAKAQAMSEDPENFTLGQAHTVMTAIFDTVHSAFNDTGFTPEVQKLLEGSVNLAVNTMLRNPKLSDILKRLESNRDSFLSWHSIALSFLSCKLAVLLGWTSEATFYRLSLASLLHDLSLDQDKLALLQTTYQINSAILNDREKAMVLNHPKNAARLLAEIPDIPSDVGLIIEQHHERQDGSGFPKGIGHKDINSISAFFIIAHDIVATMYHSPPENFDMQKYLSQRETDMSFSKGTFGQVFRVLLSKGGGE